MLTAQSRNDSPCSGSSDGSRRSAGFRHAVPNIVVILLLIVVILPIIIVIITLIVVILLIIVVLSSIVVILPIINVILLLVVINNLSLLGKVVGCVLWNKHCSGEKFEEKLKILMLAFIFRHIVRSKAVRPFSQS